MVLHRAIIVFTALFALAQPGLAGELRGQPIAVVELFTSQGCSSCPPADRVLSELDGLGNVVALAYHVDYWDYIGWRDTFGSEANSNFQRDYASAQGKIRIYTPQLMINGQEDVVGSRRRDVDAAIARAQLSVQVDLKSDADMLEVEISSAEDLKESVVWLVTFKNGADIKIERGENRGEILHYAQIVTGRRVLGMWEPLTGAYIKLPLNEVLGGESDGVAIIVQEDRNGLPGPILGAASFMQ